MIILDDVYLPYKTSGRNRAAQPDQGKPPRPYTRPQRLDFLEKRGKSTITIYSSRTRIFSLA